MPREVKDLTGMQFGNWTVIKRIESDNHRHSKWLCRCKCGTERAVYGFRLTTHTSTSCGCRRTSCGEKAISDILDSYDIQYEHEKSFNDLISTRGYKLRFDFCIYLNNVDYFIIEFQGEQHYKETERFLKFGKYQREVTDKLKRKYCKKNGIQLYEIKYNEPIKYKLIDILVSEGLLEIRRKIA